MVIFPLLLSVTKGEQLGPKCAGLTAAVFEWGHYKQRAGDLKEENRSEGKHRMRKGSWGRDKRSKK